MCINEKKSKSLKKTPNQHFFIQGQVFHKIIIIKNNIIIIIIMTIIVWLCTLIISSNKSSITSFIPVVFIIFIIVFLVFWFFYGWFLTAAQKGTASLIFMSPEALDKGPWLSFMAKFKRRVVVVTLDEVHCLSEW